MATSEKGHAIPFISFAKGKGFHITKEAEQFLLSLEGSQLGVVSITGKYRTGKSFFINRVLLNTTEDGFNVGPTINPCTKGLWLWNKTLKSENPEYADMKILLVDTEGFGGLDENSNHDTRIFIFSLLLSSFFIYNSVGNIDESALNNLSLIINLAKEIQIKSGEEPSSDESEEIAQYFPAFLWVVRDFALKLIDQNGQPISSKEYLENALKPQKGVSDLTESKNRVRRMLKHFFRERDCCTMVRPIEDEKELQKLDSMPNEVLRSEFLDQMNSVRKRIFKKVKPKTLNGQTLNGGMLLEVAKAYIDAINTGNVPNIENAWTYLCKQEAQKAMEESMGLLDQTLSSVSAKGALGEAELKDVERKLKEEMMENFKKKSIGDSQDTKVMHQEIERQFEEKVAKFRERNMEKWKESFTNWMSSNSNLEAKLKDQQYSNFYEFKNELEQMKALYDNKAPKGMNKEQFWGEYSQKMYALAAETISKKIEEQANLQNSRLSQKLEMTEKELSTKRKEFETERTSLYNKIQDVERERAYFKAQENNMSEKIEHFKHDKEKYERLYNELLSQSKQREDQITRESKEKRNELEKKLDNARNESLFKITDLEKKNALLEQEMQFIKRDDDSIKQKLGSLEQEKAQLYANLKQKEETLEEYKRKISELEMTKTHEIAQLKSELEKKATDLHYEEGKRKETVKQQSEWLIEKSYLESQVTFLKSQLEENKRLHDALLLALEQGLNNNENEGTNELVETNKNLSAAVDKMEMRCKVLEEKNEKLKKYKRMIKNSTALQCAHCSKFISVNVFLQHTSSCFNPQTSNLNKTNLITPLSSASQWMNPQDIDPNALQISINQTMVKENTDSKPYTEYLIQVSYKGTKWSVSRKYKMFCELHQNLNTQFPSLKFPESAFTLLGAFNNVNYIANSKRPTVIEERRKALQQYLRDLSKIDVVRNSGPFKKFLELDRISDRETDGSQHVRSNSQMSQTNTMNLTSYREERRPPSSLISDRNSSQKDGEHSRTYSPYGQALRPEASGYQKEVDKNTFAQSPLAFMKNFPEKALNKENKNPRSRSVIDSGNAMLHKMPMDESEFDRGDYNDISGMSTRLLNQDMSQDRSMSQTSKLDYTHHRADSSLGFNHPSTTYQQSNGSYKPQFSTMRPTYSGRNSANQYEGQSNNSMLSAKYNPSRPSHQMYQRE